MTGHLVRLVEPADIASLVALCAEHARFEGATYDGEGKMGKLSALLFGASSRLRVWIALASEQSVGYASATEEFSTWNAAALLHMDCLFVRSGHRNGGVGAALLGAVVQYARIRDLREVQWQTPAWNTDACRFYRRHGATAQQKTRFSLPVPS